MLNVQFRQPNRTTMARTSNLALLLSPITWDLFKVRLSETTLPIKNASPFQLFASWTLDPANFFWNSSSSNVYELANFSLTSRPEKNFSLVEMMYSLSNNTHTSKTGKPGDSLIKGTHISRRNAVKLRCLPHNFSAPSLALLLIRSPTPVTTDILRWILHTNIYISR
jgi:hypothetical protein